MRFGVSVPFGTTLNKHGVCHVVGAAGVREKFIGKIGAVIPVPQMVVRVHDCSLGIDDRLDDLVEPSLIACGDRLVGHPSFLVA